MNPEDELRRRLRDEIGDPEASAPSPAGAPGWAAVEAAGDRRARRHRQVLGAGAAVVLVVVVGAALVAAGHRSAQTSLTSRGTASTGEGGSTTSGPGTSGSAPSTGLPTTPSASMPAGPAPTTGPGQPVTTLGPGPGPTVAPTTASTNPAGQIDCGTAYLASGWPTTFLPSPTLQQCILSAFAAGTPAIYRERAQTDGQGGHIKITIYEVIGVHQVRRTVDATGAQPPGAVTVSVCTGLASGQDGQLAASGCTPA